MPLETTTIEDVDDFKKIPGVRLCLGAARLRFDPWCSHCGRQPFLMAHSWRPCMPEIQAASARMWRRRWPGTMSLPAPGALRYLVHDQADDAGYFYIPAGPHQGRQQHCAALRTAVVRLSCLSSATSASKRRTINGGDEYALQLRCQWHFKKDRVGFFVRRLVPGFRRLS